MKMNKDERERKWNEGEDSEKIWRRKIDREG
jgi:hypothetical protein